jgi:hypothetical protein
MAKKSAPSSPSPATVSSTQPEPAEQRIVGDCDHGSSPPTRCPQLIQAIKRLQLLNNQTVCRCMAPALALSGFRNPMSGSITTDNWAPVARDLLIERTGEPTHLAAVLWEPLSLGMSKRDSSVGAAALLSCVALRSFYVAYVRTNRVA